MKTRQALIVDDEPDIRELLELTLGRMQLNTASAASLSEAKNLLQQVDYDLCLTDMRLPDGSGLELVKWMQQNFSHIPVAVITAYGSMETAVDALKSGAFDFVSKPVDLAVLRKLVNTALKLTDPHTALDRRSRDTLLGNSKSMCTIRAKISKLARSQAPIYISGESGTGKELVARLIHEKSPRADKPFVPVNCGAIPSDLVESELFGHKKGSFTGAINDKIGLFQAAEGGTLLLDEIAELPTHMQVKLLRVLQEKSVRVVGSQQEIPIDVRILSATHKNLSALVEANEFRQDLYYRINVIELKIPPLRERSEDIEQLAQHILTILAQQNSIDNIQLQAQALQALQHYDFPGNVRELENILERAFTLCENNCINVNDLQLPTQQNNALKPKEQISVTDNQQPLSDYLDLQEKHAIEKALIQTKYNKTQAAKLLGISFRQLRYRLKKLNIQYK